MVEQRKAKAITATPCRVRGEISLSSTKEDESNNGDDTDPDKADDKYLLQF